jgi:hypothetical protein
MLSEILNIDLVVYETQSNLVIYLGNKDDDMQESYIKMKRVCCIKNTCKIVSL